MGWCSEVDEVTEPVIESANAGTTTQTFSTRAHRTFTIVGETLRSAAQAYFNPQLNFVAVCHDEEDLGADLPGTSFLWVGDGPRQASMQGAYYDLTSVEGTGSNKTFSLAWSETKNK